MLAGWLTGSGRMVKSIWCKCASKIHNIYKCFVGLGGIVFGKLDGIGWVGLDVGDAACVVWEQRVGQNKFIAFGHVAYKGRVSECLDVLNSV